MELFVKSRVREFLCFEMALRIEVFWMAVGQELVVHPFSPVVDGHSRVLILGSLPSVKSRENHFYYGIRRTGFGRF